MGFYTTANLVLVVGLGTSATCYAVFHMSERTGIIASIGEFVADIFFPLEEAQWRAQRLGGRDPYDDRYKDGNAPLMRPVCVPCPDVKYDRRSLVGYATPADERVAYSVHELDYEKYGTLVGIFKGIFYNPFAGGNGGPKVWGDADSPQNALRVPTNRVACAPITGATSHLYRGPTTDPLKYMANVLCGDHQGAFIDYVKSKGKTSFDPMTQYNKTYFPYGSPFYSAPTTATDAATNTVTDIEGGYYHKQQNGLGGRLGARRVFLPPRIRSGIQYPELTAEWLQSVGYLAFYFPFGQNSSKAPYPQFDVTFRGEPVYNWSQDDQRRYCELFLSGGAGPWQYQVVDTDQGGAPTSILAAQR